MARNRSARSATIALSLSLLVAMTGCSRSAPGALGDAGWRNARTSDRLTVGAELRKAATEARRSSYRAVVETPTGQVEITRLDGVTRFRLEAVRGDATVPVTVFQYDPADTLHFPRSVVCGPDTAGAERCRDVTLDVIGDFFTSEPLPDDFHGIRFSDIFSYTHVGVHSPARWRTLAGLAHTPLNLQRSSADGMQRLGLDDRLYITASLGTEAGDATCVAWFDSADELASGSARGGWCHRDGVWFGGTGDERLVSLGKAPEHLYFPAPVELPGAEAGLAEGSDRVARAAFPEFPAGFLDSLRLAPLLP
jgi:hypothetical protein